MSAAEENTVPSGDADRSTVTAADPRARRVRMLALLLPVLAASAAFLAWSQPWVAATLDDGRVVVAGGDVAAPALPPLALAALALVGALALAGPVFRVILGLLQSLLGAGVIAQAALVLTAPLAAAAPRVTEATGVAGLDGVQVLVTGLSVSVWPVVALVAGIAALVFGLGIAATARRWPERTRKYDAVRTVAVGGDGRLDRLDAWDALSDGDDPTAR